MSLPGQLVLKLKVLALNLFRHEASLPLAALPTAHISTFLMVMRPLFSPSTTFTTERMSPSTKQHQHLSIPKGILDLELFQPERLRYLDDDALDVALYSIHQFLRPETVKFVLEVALERQGCLEFFMSCEWHEFSCAT
jgi:hypothetical protein